MAMHVSGGTPARLVVLTALLGGGWYAALGISGSWDELAFGAAAVAVAALAGVAATRLAEVSVMIRWAWLARLWPVPGRVVSESLKVTWAGVESLRPRVVQGVLFEVPFESGAKDDPEDVGRRALVVQVISAPANSMVVAGERQGKLVVHELVPEPLAHPQDRRERREWPI